MSMRKLLRTILQYSAQQQPSLFTIEPDEADMNKWTVEFHYSDPGAAFTKVTTRFDFPVQNSEIQQPRISILMPRLTGPRIFDGALCFDVGSYSSWDPKHVDIEGFLLAVHADLFRASLSTAAEGYTEDELQHGHLHVQAVHPERLQSAEHPEDVAKLKAAKMLEVSSKCLKEGNVAKALKFATLAIRNDPHDASHYKHRAFILEGLLALRWALQDLHSAASLQEEDDWETTQEAIAVVQAQLDTIEHTTFLVGAGTCQRCGQAIEEDNAVVEGRKVHTTDLSKVWAEAQDGDTIMVWPGVYRGFHALIVPDLIIQGIACGHCGARPVLMGCGTMIDSLALDATLKRFEVRCSKEVAEDSIASCILVSHGHLVVEDCTIINHSYLGIVCEDEGSQCAVDNVMLHGGTFGCTARHKSTMKITGARLSGMQKVAAQAENGAILYMHGVNVTSTKDGVSLMSVGVVEDCTFLSLSGSAVMAFKCEGEIIARGNHISNVRWGFSLEDTHKVVVTGNFVEHCINPCLLILNAGEAEVVNNTFRHSCRPVIEIRGVKRSHVSHNLVDGSDMCGIKLSYEDSQGPVAATAIVEHNDLHCCQSGIILSPGVQAMLYGNRMFGMNVAGIELHPPTAEEDTPTAAPSYIACNTITGCKVAVSSVGGSFWLRCNLMHSNEMGVKIAGSSTAVVTGNFCASLGAPPTCGAVACFAGSAIHCEANELYAGDGCAIYLEPEVQRAVVHRNVLWGHPAAILACEKISATVTQNHIFQSPRGIEFLAKVDVAITDNLLTRCAQPAFPDTTSAACWERNSVIGSPDDTCAVLSTWVPRCLALQEVDALCSLADLPYEDIGFHADFNHIIQTPIALLPFCPTGSPGPHTSNSSVNP